MCCSRSPPQIDPLTGIHIVGLNDKVVEKLEVKLGKDLNGDGEVSSRMSPNVQAAAA